MQHLSLAMLIPSRGCAFNLDVVNDTCIPSIDDLARESIFFHLLSCFFDVR